MSDISRFDEWAILEMRSRRRVGGRVRGEEIAGVGFLRVDAQGEATADGARLFPATDVACIRVTTEERARALAERRQSVAVELVREAAARYYQVPPSALNAVGRGRALIRPRQVAMYVAHQLTGESLSAIGRAFGARHHTTALRAIVAIRRRLPADPGLRREVDSVRAWVEQEVEVEVDQ